MYEYRLIIIPQMIWRPDLSECSLETWNFASMTPTLVSQQRNNSIDLL